MTQKLKLQWTQPTTNIDGTPIVNKLDYELGRKNEAGEFEAWLTVPGSLQPDNTYVAYLEDSSLPTGVESTLVMRAINTRDTTDTQDDLYSSWSTPVSFTLSNRIPTAPADFVVTADGDILTLGWTAPVEATDGVALTHTLDYELGIKGADGEFTTLQAVEGTVQESGAYAATVNKGAIAYGVAVELALRAINTLDTEALEDDLKSAWSTAVSLTLSNGVPNAPENFSVASE